VNYNEIIARQVDFFNSGKTRDIGFRIGQLKKLRSVMADSERSLYEAIYRDFKKSEFDTYATELGFVYHEIDESIKKLPRWAKQKKVKTNLINQPATSYIIPEPLGTCLVIGAWNYPYQLSLSPLVNAIAAGNTVILKPSELPAATSAAMESMIRENFPAEYITVVEGGIPETTALLNLKFDKIFFTGSTTVGKIVYQAAAKNLIPVTLELGGKSPAIITRDCNLQDTAKRLAWAKFLNAGQTCIAPDFVMIDDKIQEEFLARMKECIQKSGYSYDHDNYVQIIDERNFHRLAALIDPRKIYYGGETDLQRRYISPTLLTGVTFDDRIMQDEIFGPLLPVISYTNLEDAVATLKSRPKPLACYIFTGNKAIRDKLLGELSFGGGVVNDAVMHISNSNLPFGGVGNSGMGSYHGYAGFVAFSHFKSILDKPFRFETNLKYPPYSERKLKWIKRLMKLQGD
jgi:aldehyde dehydrogenase (NAD+)